MSFRRKYLKVSDLVEKLDARKGEGNRFNDTRQERIAHARDLVRQEQMKAKLAYVEGRHESEPIDVALVMILQTREGDMVRCALTAVEAIRLMGMMATELGGRLVALPRSNTERSS